MCAAWLHVHAGFSRLEIENIAGGRGRTCVHIKPFWIHTNINEIVYSTGYKPFLRSSTGMNILVGSLCCSTCNTPLQGSWKQQLRRKFKNMRRPSGKKRPREESEAEREEPSVLEGSSSTEHGEPLADSQPKKNRRASEIAVTEDEENGYDDNVAALAEETAKSEPSRKVIKSLMAKTFTKRRQWIFDECPRVQDVVDKFPPLLQGLNNVRTSSTILSRHVFFYLLNNFLLSCGRNSKVLFQETFQTTNSLKRSGCSLW